MLTETKNNQFVQSIEGNFNFRVGDTRYLLYKEIEGVVACVWVQDTGPKTSRGIECVDGCLAHFTDTAGTTHSTYADGMARVANIERSVYEDPAGYEDDYITWSVTWERVSNAD